MVKPESLRLNLTQKAPNNRLSTQHIEKHNIANVLMIMFLYFILLGFLAWFKNLLNWKNSETL